jgi:hypothetical protein
MYKSTSARLMPSMILSNAANTAADGPTFVVVRREDVAGEGDGVASGDLATVFGVGEGLGAMVRVRLDGEVLLFCASAAPALTSTIERVIASRFIVGILLEKKTATEAPRHRD